MCEPVSLTLLALGTAAAIASSTVSYVGAREASKAQNDAAEQNRRYAIASQRQQTAAVHQRLLQQRSQVAQDLNERNILNQQARARAVVSAGQAGASGLSIDALLADYDRASAESQFASELNLGIMRTEARNQIETIRAQTQDRINSVPTTAGPSDAAFGLSLGSTALSTAGSAYSMFPAGGAGSTGSQFASKVQSKGSSGVYSGFNSDVPLA